ncbi:serine/threonine-protein kinase [Streptomyces sp. NRRL WC-3742]|uniref:serine/threonine-protein kinase n=1 Tax=Streptomyces sp. NRRL WC-3742 TaxID=1463934 RepID=UPI000691AB38|nr:serine/threonine-protein kinase [Streptomyces sp. NRRL WC-3742]
MGGEEFRFRPLRDEDPDELGGFQLVARLPTGGMGEVFLALSPGGQPAAVKVIRDDLGQEPEFKRRFAYEVTAAQRVRGAYVAPLLDAQAHADRPWLATTYVAGPSLRELVSDHGALPAGQVLQLAWGIAHALTDIHRAEVVHRDFKPGNIMLDETGPKVIDFGIVKSLAETAVHRSQSTRIGTPLYMSPEQAKGDPVGASSDVFALGSTLYYLATGADAFGADNEIAVGYRIMAEEPDMSAVPEPLRDLIARCLRKRPDRRPTPEAVREWCEEALGDAPGPGTWMRITGASTAVRRRTDALHAVRVGLTANRPEPTAVRTEPAPTVGTVPSVPRRRWRAAVRRWFFLGGACLALLAAAALPFLRESWSRKGSDVQLVEKVYEFDPSHLFEKVSSGIPGVEGLWALLPAGIVGTTVALAVAAACILRHPEGGNVWALGKAVGTVFWMWIAGVVFVGGITVVTTFGLAVETDAPGYIQHLVLLPGGWLLLLANALAAGAVRLTWLPDEAAVTA